MVCRENKARSTTMGVLKVLLRRSGYGDFTDSELQSMIHEMRHNYDAAEDPKSEDYVAYLKGLRQQVLNDPHLTDGEKFRPDTGRASQPGFITRLDQELERFRTGMYTDPVTGVQRKLTKAQMNLGSDFAAMARLGQPLSRAQHAKDAYCELYARHTGVTVDEARSRMRDLVDRPMGERQNTQISLTDGWRDELAVAGLSAQQQADMGQSNQVREALRLMEAERRAKVATYPRRPALRPEHQVPVLSSEDPQVATQCVGGCGQYGHTADQCPHQPLTKALADAQDSYSEARSLLELQTDAVDAAQKIHDLKALQDSGTPLPDALDQVDPGWRHLDTDDRGHVSGLEDMAARYDRDALRRAQQGAKAARADLEAAEARLEAARGTVPLVSSYVQNLAYNPETGAVAVTTRGYTLKRTGEERPPKTYVYRMSQDEYDAMMASAGGGDIGSAVSNTLMARRGHGVYGGNTRFKWENDADAEAARTQSQCPTCGQWASLNSGHSCPVDGAMTNREEHVWREQRRLQRERAELAKLPTIIRDNAPRHRVMSQAAITMPDRGKLVLPHPRETSKILDNGGVAIGPVAGQYLGAQVNGRAFVWKEPGTGRRLYRLDNLRCTCGESDCRHLDMLGSAVGSPMRAQRTYGTPGTRDLSRPDKGQVSIDTYAGSPDRLNYADIQDTRRENVARFARQDSGTRRANYPTGPTGPDGRRLSPAEVPTTWSSPRGDVDLTSAPAVAYEVRHRISERTGQPPGLQDNWLVSTDSSGGVWIRSAEAQVTGGRMWGKHQAELAQAFGLAHRTGDRGIYIAPDRASRHELLERLEGREPTIRGGFFVAGPTDPTGN